MPSTDYNFRLDREDHAGVVRTEYKAASPEIVKRGVCQRCNNGWMNRLDLDAQPMLTAMADGKRFPVTELPNKVLLAQWICKVVLVFDRMQEDEPALTDDHAEWLFRERTPPPDWKIWLAALATFPEYHATLGAFTLIRPQGRGFLATIGINHFVAQALVLPASEPVGAHPMASHVVLLWPPPLAPVDWPPPVLLQTPAELESFGRIIAGEALHVTEPPPRVPL